MFIRSIGCKWALPMLVIACATTAVLAQSAAAQTAKKAVAAGLADGAVILEESAADAVFMTSLAVGPVGPATTDNCDALRAALHGITDNDAGNRYLIDVEPGVYDCGSTAVRMKSFVDIRGAGRDVTILRGDPPSGLTSGLIVLAGDSELRSLSVRIETDTRGPVIGIYGSGARNARVTDLAVTVDKSTPGNLGNAIGMALEDGSHIVLTDVVSSAIRPAASSPMGIFVLDSDVEMINVTAVATPGDRSSGLRTNKGNTIIRDSVLRGDFGVRSVGSGGEVRIASSLIENGTTGAASFTCVGAHDQNMAVLGATCRQSRRGVAWGH